MDSTCVVFLLQTKCFASHSPIHTPIQAAAHWEKLGVQCLAQGVLFLFTIAHIFTDMTQQLLCYTVVVSEMALYQSINKSALCQTWSKEENDRVRYKNIRIKTDVTSFQSEQKNTHELRAHYASLRIITHTTPLDLKGCQCHMWNRYHPWSWAQNDQLTCPTKEEAAWPSRGGNPGLPSDFMIEDTAGWVGSRPGTGEEGMEGGWFYGKKGLAVHGW